MVYHSLLARRLIIEQDATSNLLASSNFPGSLVRQLVIAFSSPFRNTGFSYGLSQEINTILST